MKQTEAAGKKNVTAGTYVTVFRQYKHPIMHSKMFNNNKLKMFKIKTNPVTKLSLKGMSLKRTGPLQVIQTLLCEPHQRHPSLQQAHPREQDS